MKKKLAGYVSWMTGMHVWFPVLLVVCLFKTGLTSQQIILLFPILFSLLVIVPIVYVAIALHLRWVSAWDLPKREERYVFFGVVLLSTLVSVILVYLLGTKLAFSIITILFFLMIILAGITKFWKISLHTSLATISAIILNFFFHWQLPILYLIIPLVVWARYTLKRHTIGQMIAGILISAGFILGAFAFLGYF